MRVKIGRARKRAGFAEYRPNLVRVRPMRPIEADSAKLEIVIRRDLGFRKERVLRTEAFLLAQEGDPIDENLADVLADRKEPGRKRLRPLRPDLTRVLFNQFAFDVDMLQLEGDDRPNRGGQREA